jgi:hypothetical protein
MKSKMSKDFEAHAQMGLRGACKPRKFADGGLVKKRLADMESMSSGNYAAAAPTPAPAPAPTPAPAPAAAQPMTPEEIAFRQKHNMMPGQPKPTVLSSVKKRLGFADGGRVDLREAISKGRRGEVKGPGGPTDDKVPAMLSDGEYVLPADTVEQIGVENLDALLEETHVPADDTDMKNGVRAYNDGSPGGVRTGEYIPKQPGTALVTRPNWIAGGQSQYTQGPAGPAPGVADAGAPYQRATAEQTAAKAARPTLQQVSPTIAKGVDLLKTGYQHVGGVRGAAGRIAPMVAPAVEAMDVSKVANSDKTSAADVANQVAAGTGRVGAAMGGAGLGSIFGPVGAIAGGIGGYLLSDTLIKGGRKAAGVESRDPAERIAPPSSIRTAAAPAAPAGFGTNETLRVSYPEGGGAAGSKEFESEVERWMNHNGTPPLVSTPAWEEAQRRKDQALFSKLSEGVQNQVAPGQLTEMDRLAYRDQKEQQARRDAFNLRRYGDPNRYSPDAIAAEHAEIASRHAQPGGLRAGPGTWTEKWQNRSARRAEASAAKLRSAESIAARSNAITMRGQDLTHQSAMTGHQMTGRGQDMSNMTALQRLAFDQQQGLRDQGNKDRDYGLNVRKTDAEIGRVGLEQERQAADARDRGQKALTDRITSMIPPGPDGKPDAARAAHMMTAVNAGFANKVKEMQDHFAKTGDPRSKQWLDTVGRQGVHAMGEDDIRKLVIGVQVAQVARENHSKWNPFGGTAVHSDAPVTSLRRKPGIITDDYVTDRGDVIPARKLDKVDGLRNTNIDILKAK